MSGDSDALPGGGGTVGSRSLVSGGGAIQLAAEDVITNGRRVAAAELGVGEDEIEFVDGRFSAVGSAQSISVAEVAAVAAGRASVGDTDAEAGLIGIGEMGNGVRNFPNGVHICEVDVDKDTGNIDVARYTVVDDFGRVLNPLLVEGQVHGGIAQGIGQAMLELAAYDKQSGQLLSGSFTDYAMPRADHFPNIAFDTNEVLCKTNWLGAKGAGEAGTVGALPAFVNAVVDALEEYGIEHLDMPLQPERVWRAIREASEA